MSKCCVVICIKSCLGLRDTKGCSAYSVIGTCLRSIKMKDYYPWMWISIHVKSSIFSIIFHCQDVCISLCSMSCTQIQYSNRNYIALHFVSWPFGTCHHHFSSLGSRCVPWLGEGLSMSSPNDPVLYCPLPYRVAPVFVQVVSPSLGWSPLSSFLVIWSPSGDAWGPSVVFEAVNMLCPGPFHFSQCTLYLWVLSSPWPRCWSFYLCMWCWAYFFPFWSVRPQVCSVLVWSVSRGQDYKRFSSMSRCSTHNLCSEMT